MELLGVKFLLLLPALLPLKAAVKVGGNLLGLLAFDVVRIRRRVTLENIKRAFGDRYSKAERIRIGRASYVNFAKSMIEFASLKRLGRAKLLELVEMDGLEIVDQCLAGNHGIVAVTGHFGSWEMLGAAMAARGYGVDFLVGEQANTMVDDLINDLRRSAGIGTISRGVAAKGIFRSLKENRIVALLGDQDARRAGIFVDFFGTPASTFQGAAQFAYRAKSPIVCCFIVRGTDERHRAFFMPPIEPRPEAPRDNEIVRMTAEHTRALEEFVTRYPDHYFWAHKRWKTRPRS